MNKYQSFDSLEGLIQYYKFERKIYNFDNLEG
jgi:hypothetical protein